jgi:hypothetical protein
MDWTSPWAGLSFRLGRNYWALANSLLLDTAGSGTALNVVAGAANGFRASGSFSGFSYQVLGFNKNTVGSPAANTYAANVETTLAGWTVGGNFRQDQADSALNGNGYSVYGSGAFFPGFTLAAEYASFTPTGGASTTALWANVAIDTGAMGMGFLSGADVWIKNYQVGSLNNGNNIGSLGGFWLGPDVSLVNAFGADATVKLMGWNVKFGYESGTANSADVAGLPTGANYSVQLVNAEYGLAANTVLGVEYRQLQNTTAGTTPLAGYAGYVTYKW